MNKKKSHHYYNEGGKEIFIPLFTPPPITKDWERSFQSPFQPKHQYFRETARTLRALHFFLNDEEAADQPRRNIQSP